MRRTGGKKSEAEISRKENSGDDETKRAGGSRSVEETRWKEISRLEQED